MTKLDAYSLCIIIKSVCACVTVGASSLNLYFDTQVEKRFRALNLLPTRFQTYHSRRYSYTVPNV